MAQAMDQLGSVAEATTTVIVSEAENVSSSELLDVVATVSGAGEPFATMAAVTAVAAAKGKSKGTSADHSFSQNLMNTMQSSVSMTAATSEVVSSFSNALSAVVGGSATETSADDSAATTAATTMDPDVALQASQLLLTVAGASGSLAESMDVGTASTLLGVVGTLVGSTLGGRSSGARSISNPNSTEELLAENVFSSMNSIGDALIIDAEVGVPSSVSSGSMVLTAMKLDVASMASSGASMAGFSLPATDVSGPLAAASCAASEVGLQVIQWSRSPLAYAGAATTATDSAIQTALAEGRGGEHGRDGHACSSSCWLHAAGGACGGEKARAARTAATGPESCPTSKSNFGRISGINLSPLDMCCSYAAAFTVRSRVGGAFSVHVGTDHAGALAAPRMSLKLLIGMVTTWKLMSSIVTMPDLTYPPARTLLISTHLDTDHLLRWSDKRSAFISVSSDELFSRPLNSWKYVLSLMTVMPAESRPASMLAPVLSDTCTSPPWSGTATASTPLVSAIWTMSFHFRTLSAWLAFCFSTLWLAKIWAIMGFAMATTSFINRLASLNKLDGTQLSTILITVSARSKLYLVVLIMAAFMRVCATCTVEMSSTSMSLVKGLSAKNSFSVVVSFLLAFVSTPRIARTAAVNCEISSAVSFAARRTPYRSILPISARSLSFCSTSFTE
ncbi:unnamed protein product [Prorocentrum cordatum]|uniref:Uncharacterized protein n=1 Tax=Prorocentrum cordatum TaxID=2364126 RepID=A0ABN9V2L9_9DINO|nr:unnamed protein product [Polarella glacialis]